MIRKATSKDLNEIKKLTEACAKALQKQNIFQWNEHYPSREKLQNDIEQEELFIYKKEQDIIAIMVLTTKMDSVYRNINWFTKSSKNKHLYVHRLATHPNYWGNGYAKKMMDFAEEYAKSNHFISIRLDTFSKNTRNQKFYENRGYTKLGAVYFPHKNEYPFHCYEKIILNSEASR